MKKGDKLKKYLRSKLKEFEEKRKKRKKKKRRMKSKIGKFEKEEEINSEKGRKNW